MTPEHRRARVRRLAVGAAAVAGLATLAAGPAAGVEVVRAAGAHAPVPTPAAAPAVTAPAAPAVP
ncbi:hypothetical protein C1I97_36805, partial [Streptomyces sp. NTH33]